MNEIKHTVVVLSGKGGVGKSTVAVNLAVSLAEQGYRTGLLDVDIHGPTVPYMLGLENRVLQGRDGELFPVLHGALKVVSIGFMLKDPDDAVIWRGPVKTGVIRQFLDDVVWGGLDYLIIDSPPGTGDEPLTVCQNIKNPDGAVIVTTPQRIAAVDVRKSVTFCRKVNMPVLGVVENMSGMICPKCGELYPIFGSGAGHTISLDMNIPFLGSIPFDPVIGRKADEGEGFFPSREINSIIERLTEGERVK
ncbi:MAG: P-loop NTPase [Spirochaetia bacterium]